MVDGPLTGNAFTRMAGGVLPRVDDFLLGGATGAMINQGRNLYDSAGNLVAVARGDMTEDEFSQRGQDMLQRDTSTGIMFPSLSRRLLIRTSAYSSSAIRSFNSQS